MPVHEGRGYLSFTENEPNKERKIAARERNEGYSSMCVLGY